MFKLYRQRLSLWEKGIYDSLLKGLMDTRESIKVLSTNIDSLDAIIEFIRLDCPWLFYLDRIEYKVNYGLHTIVLPIYSYVPDKIEAIKNQIKSIQSQVALSIKGYDTWTKVLSIHDYICKNVAYKQIGKDAHSIVGPYIYKQSVCEGIAKCFKALCDELGIESCVVTGKAKPFYDAKYYEAHSWNQVNINGQWVNVDVTYDLTLSDGSYIRHDYLFLADEQIKFSHIKTVDNGIKCLSVEYDYFRINNLIMNRQKDFIDFLKNNINQRNYEFEIKLLTVSNVDNIEQKVLYNAQKALTDLNMNAKIEIGVNKELLVFFIKVKLCRFNI